MGTSGEWVMSSTLEMLFKKQHVVCTTFKLLSKTGPTVRILIFKCFHLHFFVADMPK